jgi:hypothetical protein
MSLPSHIKENIDKRNRMLVKNKPAKCPEITRSIENLNKEIKSHFL